MKRQNQVGRISEKAFRQALLRKLELDIGIRCNDAVIHIAWFQCSIIKQAIILQWGVMFKSENHASLRGSVAREPLLHVRPRIKQQPLSHLSRIGLRQTYII